MEILESLVDENIYVYENETSNGTIPKKYMLPTIKSMSQGNTCWCGGFMAANRTSSMALASSGEKRSFHSVF